VRCSSTVSLKISRSAALQLHLRRSRSTWAAWRLFFVLASLPCRSSFLVVHKSWHAVTFGRMMRRSEASLSNFLFGLARQTKSCCCSKYGTVVSNGDFAFRGGSDPSRWPPGVGSSRSSMAAYLRTGSVVEFCEIRVVERFCLEIAIEAGHLDVY
jgi:hypothetical protein